MAATSAMTSAATVAAGASGGTTAATEPGGVGRLACTGARAAAAPLITGMVTLLTTAAVGSPPVGMTLLDAVASTGVGLRRAGITATAGAKTVLSGAMFNAIVDGTPLYRKYGRMAGKATGLALIGGTGRLGAWMLLDCNATCAPVAGVKRRSATVANGAVLTGAFVGGGGNEGGGATTVWSAASNDFAAAISGTKARIADVAGAFGDSVFTTAGTTGLAAAGERSRAVAGFATLARRTAAVATALLVRTGAGAAVTAKGDITAAAPGAAATAGTGGEYLIISDCRSSSLASPVDCAEAPEANISPAAPSMAANNSWVAGSRCCAPTVRPPLAQPACLDEASSDATTSSLRD